jgi:hypothetical protein
MPPWMALVRTKMIQQPCRQGQMTGNANLWEILEVFAQDHNVGMSTQHVPQPDGSHSVSM